MTDWSCINFRQLCLWFGHNTYAWCEPIMTLKLSLPEGKWSRRKQVVRKRCKRSEASLTPNWNTIKLFQHCLPVWLTYSIQQQLSVLLDPTTHTLDTATQWGIERLVQRWNVCLPLLSKQYYMKLRSFRCNEASNPDLWFTEIRRFSPYWCLFY